MQALEANIVFIYNLFIYLNSCSSDCVVLYFTFKIDKKNLLFNCDALVENGVLNYVRYRNGWIEITKCKD